LHEPGTDKRNVSSDVREKGLTQFTFLDRCKQKRPGRQLAIFGADSGSSARSIYLAASFRFVPGRLDFRLRKNRIVTLANDISTIGNNAIE